ncbi:NAD(P)-dependent oxidoreductase [Streptomyces sp. NPDC028722]|uniref:2-hydroxyacid dehydrogenase n=1 Tax=Streptomyces sp. NPDC028722 TaxID=3155016 RepID=UPI0033E5A4DF
MTAVTPAGAARIIYLDEPTYITAGFLACLSGLGSVQVHFDRPGPQETVRRLREADVVLVEWTRLTAEILRAAPTVRHIATMLSATDQIDLRAAADLGISVSHCPRYSVAAVAEHVLVCVAALSRRLLPAHGAGAAGVSHRYVPFLGREAHEQVLGLVGTGRIGQAVAARGRALGMRVLGSNSRCSPVPGIEVVDLAELARRSDVICVQVPFTDATRGLLSAELIDSVRVGAIVVSVSRAGTIDLGALARRHVAGELGGVALDDTPADLVPVLADVPNTLLTPGTAWYTRRSRTENLAEVLSNVRGFLEGEAVNVVT